MAGNDNDFAELRQALRDSTEQYGDGHDYLTSNDTIAWKFTHACFNHLPAILAALDQARAERDELRREASQVDEQLAWIEENGETYTKEALLDFIRRARQDSEPTEVLAARDARLKREGAAEWLENAAREGGYYERSSEGMLEEAKQLRDWIV